DLSIKMTIIVPKLFKVFCWGFDFLKNQSPNKTYTTKGRVPNYQIINIKLFDNGAVLLKISLNIQLLL
ncbi:hypothetical protein, partial [Arcicella rigui]